MKEEQIGERIKALRKINKMTLKQLSQQTGLSTGFLSQFERGLSNIAVDSLQKIAEALGVELYSFFKPTSTEGVIDKTLPVVRSYQQPVLTVIGEQFVIKNLSAKLSDKTLFPRLVEILPFETHESVKAYSHEGEEFVYVLEGVMTLLYGKLEHQLYPGDSAHYFSKDKHNWVNKTSKVVKIICVSIPNKFIGGRLVTADE